MLQRDDEVVLPDHLNALLHDRTQLIERLMLDKDIEGLKQVLQSDRENVAGLQAELSEIAKSISNINKIQQYVSCTE